MERSAWKLLQLSLALPWARALDNGLALTPPMGWMTWQRYRCETNCSGAGAQRCINEELIKEMADRMAKDGWLDAGYQYINIDDCWMLPERAEGRLVPDPQRFPSGMAALGEYIHQRGLKFGTYGDIGSKTCQGLAGFHDHFEEDAQTLADWKVDYIKVDGCNENQEDMARDYPAFGAALNKTGRPIVYSCSWPAYMPHNCEKTDGCMKSLIQHCNLWRNFDDVADSWDSVKSITNFWKRLNSSDEMVQSAGPGHWNDPDMLLVGGFGLSVSEAQSQFALWSLFAAPLFMSNDLRDISQEARDILQNREVIAVNQDPLGKQGFCVAGCDGNLRVWARPLAGGDIAVIFQNLGFAGDGDSITLTTSTLPFETFRIFKARDLFAKKDLGIFREELTLYVHVSSARMICISGATEQQMVV